MPAMTALIVVGLVVVFVAMKDSIYTELKLLLECHDNPDHLAQKINDMRKNIEDKNTKLKLLKEKHDHFVEEKDFDILTLKSKEDAAYGRGYWSGVFCTLFWVSIFTVCTTAAYRIYNWVFVNAEREYDQRMALINQRFCHPLGVQY